MISFVSMNNIYPFKGRHINLDKQVDVYRCLNRSGKMYSIRQRGVVVGHTDNIALENCEFVINSAGKKKALETKQRNVHAYIRGTITYRTLLTLAEVKYHPFNDAGFESDGKSIFKTKGITINELGVRAINGNDD